MLPLGVCVGGGMVPVPVIVPCTPWMFVIFLLSQSGARQHSGSLVSGTITQFDAKLLYEGHLNEKLYKTN